MNQHSLRNITFTVALAATGVAVGFAGGRNTLVASSQQAALPPSSQVAETAPSITTASYSAVVDRVAPAVVTIRVEKQAEVSRTALPEGFRDFFGQQPRMDPRGQRQSGLGSGVIIRPDGHILTNHHVIARADRIRVDLADGRSLPATLVGADEASDLAVLKVEAQGLPTVAFGDSDRIKVGDVVLAFGNPLGVGQTVTMGIVSAKGRATGTGDGSYEDFLQTDAPINQGNSGGALVNLQGELVGINAQILSPSGGNIGLGFAIPSTMARAVTEQLTEDGVVHRSKLGVTVQQVTPGAGGEPERGRRPRCAGERRRTRRPRGTRRPQAGRRHRRARRPQGDRCQRRAQSDRRHEAGVVGVDRRGARRQARVAVGSPGGASADRARGRAAGGKRARDVELRHGGHAADAAAGGGTGARAR